MNNETDKPNPRVSVLKSVVRATAMVRKIWEEDQLRDMAADHLGGEQPHQEPWRIFAHESGLMELVEAAEEMERAEFSHFRERSTASHIALIEAQRKVAAAARSVREG